MPARTSLQRLDFNDKLVQSGKKETAEVTLKRLKTLHQKLSTLEQDLTDKKSLDPICRPLIHNTILHHKDRGVKAYAACCLADLLRLYAPDAPYNERELRDIFQFFYHQLKDNFHTPPAPLGASRRANDASQSSTPGAASQRITDIAYYTEYVYLIESLATIKSVVLACDAANGDDIVHGFFETFVQIVRPDMSKGLIRHLVTILSVVIEEGGAVPPDVMSIIIEQFESKTQPDAAFQLIIDVCNATSDKLQRPVLAHFTEIQMKHGRDPSNEDAKILALSHKLILTMYRHAPGLLLNVIPVLEENLRAAEQVPLRAISTRTLGKMFGERPVVGNGTADLARAYPSAWRAWLGRRLDKAVNVRLAWVESSRVVLTNHPELRQEIQPFLVDRIEDSSDLVRSVICKVICALDYETALHQINEATLRAVGSRMSDKKSNVRAEAITGLAKLWSAAYSEIESGGLAEDQFGWIPETMLHCLQRDVSVDMRAQMTTAFKEHILPLGEDSWVDRLMLVATRLDDAAFKALEKMTGLRGYAKGASPYRAFVDLCEANNGGIIDQDAEEIKSRLAFVIDAMATQLFPDPSKARKDLEQFAAANEARLYKLFKACVDPQSDLKTLTKARNEFIRRIEQSHSDLLDTCTILLHHACFDIVNPSSISPLLKIMSKPNAPPAASRLLTLMAKECAIMCRAHVAELGVAMTDKRLSEVALQALAALAKVDGATMDAGRLVPKATKIVIEGTSRQSKFAARLVSYLGSTEAIGEIIKTLAKSLPDLSPARLIPALCALSEFALSSPAQFELRSSEIHEFVLELIHRHLGSENSDAWVDASDLPEPDQAKLIALRVITHRVLGFARASNALEIATPVLDLLDTILANDGLISGESSTTRAHLRLRASLCALKLANVKVFDKAMGKILERIAWVIKDPIYHVRHLLLLKLASILPIQRLLPRWNVLPVMIALDPSRENIHMAKSVMSSVVKACRHFSKEEKVDRIEMPLARLVWLLASDGDNDWTLADVRDFARYFELFFDCVVNRDNIGLVFQLAGKIKSLKSTTGGSDTTLYKLSELAQIVIRNRGNANHWTIPSYSGAIRFPRDIFHNLPNQDAVLENTKKSYLTSEEANWANNLGRKTVSRESPKKTERKVSKKRARKAESASDSESSGLSEAEEESAASEAEAEPDSGVMGRGGRRNAKSAAKRGLKTKTKKPKPDTESSSELSELDE
ncbi:armadillo-type protein [Kockovaella imperatae]|uniref:Armadillo-type protein n=1 Tax=Kockovaella imperatae TaxID=4999 RepID=A0A1Y1U8S7_9TREE|nr:armadillo-type protein [Kockovaella imperatae]ORX33887.1 armadillo-type protein [Kockovaella imperatae]